MRNAFLVLVICLAVWTPLGCGSGGTQSPGDSTNTIERGPFSMAVGFIQTLGETLRLNLHNLTALNAPVFVTFYNANGTNVGGFNATLAPNATLKRTIGGVLGGWAHVETRDVNNLDANGLPTVLQTSGYVGVGLDRDLGGTDEDSAPASAGRFGTFNQEPRVFGSFNYLTTRYQVINRSYDGNTGLPLSVNLDITVYDVLGNAVFNATQGFSANGAFVGQVGAVAGLPDTGLIHVMPSPLGSQPAGVDADTVFHFDVFTQLRHLQDFQVAIEPRFTQAHEPIPEKVGFDFRFGIDTVGNTFDFFTVFTNPTDTNQTITINQVYTAGGAPQLPGPMDIILRPKATKLAATTDVLSRGWDLAAGEQSPYVIPFGDVNLSSGAGPFFVDYSVGPEVSVWHVNYDSVANTFVRVVRNYGVTTNTFLNAFPIEVTSAGTRRNYVHVMNLQTQPIQISPVVFTPGGTRYDLDPISIGPIERVDVSLDGQIFREDPTDLNEPPVACVCLQLVSLSGLAYTSRSELRNGADQILWVSPRVFRDANK